MSPICFPVQEQVTYTSSFGAPRSGHTHQGNDLIGQKMFHLLSAADGVIVDLRGPRRGRASGSAGNAIRIRGDDGWFHIYYHVNNDTPGTDDGQAARQHVFAPGIDEGVRVTGRRVRRRTWVTPATPKEHRRTALRASQAGSRQHQRVGLDGDRSLPVAASRGEV